MASTLPKLRVSDLIYDATTIERLPLRSRTRELAQVARLLAKQSQSNIVISGPRGIGKTALVYGLAEAVKNQAFPGLAAVPYLLLDTPSFVGVMRDPVRQEEFITHAQAAFASLPASVLIIDEADSLLAVCQETWQLEQLFQPFFEGKRHLILAVAPEGWERLQATHRNSLKFFSQLTLNELSGSACRTILLDHARSLAVHYRLQIEEAAIDAIVEQLPRLAHGQSAVPRAAISLLDEGCAAGALEQKSVITAATIERLLADRQGMLVTGGRATQTNKIAQLPHRLLKRIKGQDQAIATITPLVQRGWLGLSNPSRPIASFLFLGPSGVGKTELAKALAEEVFGSSAAVVRIDMSEFGDAHTVQRLLGAPPGYVGYEAGGQLTTPIAARPFSLILLDEMEKAHPSVFDIFLQVLDDGRLTDGRGNTVDFTKTIIIATSNIGVDDIVARAAVGEDVTRPNFYQAHLMPALRRHFRVEFLNRFEAVCTFAPLTPADLLAIAHLELEKIQQRIDRHGVTVELSEDILRRKIEEIYNPRFGARPIKRFVEQTCEAAVAKYLLQPA